MQNRYLARKHFTFMLGFKILVPRCLAQNVRSPPIRAVQGLAGRASTGDTHLRVYAGSQQRRQPTQSGHPGAIASSINADRFRDRGRLLFKSARFRGALETSLEFPAVSIPRQSRGL